MKSWRNRMWATSYLFPPVQRVNIITDFWLLKFCGFQKMHLNWMIINEVPSKSCIAEGNNAFWTLKDIFPFQMHPLLSALQIYTTKHTFSITIFKTFSRRILKLSWLEVKSLSFSFCQFFFRFNITSGIYKQ